jgi:hypothetical protein
MKLATMIAQAKHGPAKGLWVTGMAALLIVTGIPLAAQTVGATPNTVRNLLNQPANPPAHAAAAPASSSGQAAPPKPLKPATQTLPLSQGSTASAKSAGPAAGAHPAAPLTNPAAKTTAPTAVKTNATTTTAQAAPIISRRDPFDPLVGKERDNASALSAERLPPGKAGLLITTLRVDGVVHGPGGMIAIVSNPQQRVYFLREGDSLFDGRVAKISMEAVAFHQAGKDPFGAPVVRDVTKQLYPTPGEQP